MQMIDDANRATTIPEKEQWTIRGWPKGLALFHKNKCQCCNDYVAHTIKALKWPQSTTSATMTSSWPTTPASSVAGPSSRQTAPLPARAMSSLASRMAKPGLASRLEMPPETDRYNDLSYDFTDDVPSKDTEMPAGWEIDPNWDSDVSVWDEMIDPEDAPKASGKKRKKRAHDSEPQSGGWLAARDKATREYLARLTSHTVVDEMLKRELRMAYRSFALQEAERAKNVVVPTPQFADLTVRPRYLGEPLPHGDPPIPVTGRLPRPLGRSVP
jgi:hypothetical protein